MKRLTVMLIKPSKYREDGFVERFSSGFMPNATLSHIASMTPDDLSGHEIKIRYIDEYIRADGDYLNSIHPAKGEETLLAIVGVQSHQFHRAIDLAAFAIKNGIRHIVIGGPHPMTCDTSLLHGKGISFSLSEAELVWHEILQDTIDGQLRAVYGTENRWTSEIPKTTFRPPPPDEVSRHWVPMVGLYPVRGCPFSCNFCSVIKIAGRSVRYPTVESTIAALKEIKKAGISLVVFTSDNFNKFPMASTLLDAMIDENLEMDFFFQADTQIAKQPHLVDLIGRAGGVEMFLGVESFDKNTLAKLHKSHNKPDTYGEIIRLCNDAGIRAHFSNIIGFPDQTESSIGDHLESLLALGPELASFYILTPIPGTDQYKDFMADDLVFEKNLDRFDTTSPTFHHANISADRLQQLLFDAYEIFYKRTMNSSNTILDRTTRNYMAFCRWSARNRIHPMSGGSGRVEIDRVEDYAVLRTSVFDIEGNLPLPNNLELTEKDARLNSKGNWKRLD